MNSPIQSIRGIVYRILAQSAIADLIGNLAPNPIRTKDGLIEVGPNCLPRTKSCIWLGIYEHAERHLINRHLPCDCDCIEFGASIGVVSLSILRKIESSRRHMAVEASPLNIPVLKRNIASNIESNNSDIIHRALAYNSPFVSFSSGNDNLSGRINHDSESGGRVDVNSVRLYEIRPESGYSVVMDVEGAEFDMMENDNLDGCRCLIVELHGNKERNLEFIGWIHGQGLELVEQKHSVYCFMRIGSHT